MTEQQVKALKKLCPVKFNQQDYDKKLAMVLATTEVDQKYTKHFSSSRVGFLKLVMGCGKQGLELAESKLITGNSFFTHTPKQELVQILKNTETEFKATYMQDLELQQLAWLESEMKTLLVAKEHKSIAKKEAEKEKLFKSLLGVINE